MERPFERNVRCYRACISAAGEALRRPRVLRHGGRAARAGTFLSVAGGPGTCRADETLVQVGHGPGEEQARAWTIPQARPGRG